MRASANKTVIVTIEMSEDEAKTVKCFLSEITKEKVEYVMDDFVDSMDEQEIREIVMTLYDFWEQLHECV